MRFTSTLLAVGATISLTSALPLSDYAAPSSEFFLVTTSQSEQTSNSSQLRGVSATTPFAPDPVSQSYLVLRLIGSGYNSLPNFTLTSGTLSTVTTGPHGIGSYQYNSSVVTADSQLTFLPGVQPAGNIALKEGYLVTVDGESEGWTICEGDAPLGQEVLYWKGTKEGCEKTFLQAVEVPPYKKP